jgi:hypothetical protein
MDKSDLKKKIVPAVGGIAAGLLTLTILKTIATKLRSSNKQATERKVAVFHGDQGKVFQVGSDFQHFLDRVANHFKLGSVVVSALY